MIVMVLRLDFKFQQPFVFAYPEKEFGVLFLLLALSEMINVIFISYTHPHSHVISQAGVLSVEVPLIPVSSF